MAFYKQCLYRRFVKLPGYTTVPDLKKYVNSLYGLAFVPVHDVQMTWNDLKLLLLRLFPTIIGPSSCDLLREYMDIWDLPSRTLERLQLHCAWRS